MGISDRPRPISFVRPLRNSAEAIAMSLRSGYERGVPSTKISNYAPVMIAPVPA